MRRQSIQEQYKALQNTCQEMSEHIRGLQEDLDLAYKELCYLHEFICYKELETEYACFQEMAHEEYYGDLPFPRLTL